MHRRLFLAFLLGSSSAIGVSHPRLSSSRFNQTDSFGLLFPGHLVNPKLITWSILPYSWASLPSCVDFSLDLSTVKRRNSLTDGASTMWKHPV